MNTIKNLFYESRVKSVNSKSNTFENFIKILQEEHFSENEINEIFKNPFSKD